MKLLYILSDYPTFSETFIRAEIEQWRDKGYEVSVISLKPRITRKRLHGVIYNSLNPLIWLTYFIVSAVRGKSALQSRVFRRNLIQGIVKNPSNLFTWLYFACSADYLIQLAQDEQADYILAHFLFKGSLFASLIGDKIGTPYHLRVHTSSTNLSFKQQEFLVNNATSISAISRNSASFIRDRFQDNKVIVVRQSLLPRLKPIVRHERNIEERIKLICAGRFAREKGFEELILAIGLIDKTTLKNLELNIYGEGHLRGEYQHLIESLELQQNIFVHEKIDHHTLMNHIADSDLLVVPSKKYKTHVDGIPTVIPEAMMLGTPVLATKVGGISEIIQDNETGFLVNTNAPGELHEALITVLRNKSSWHLVTDKARLKVIREYDLNLSDCSEQIFIQDLHAKN
ncbi:glycosyltransferase family 4 protein [bacterium]|nr:glycosyltransferase family 4 protein [bacterium]